METSKLVIKEIKNEKVRKGGKHLKSRKRVTNNSSIDKKIEDRPLKNTGKL